MAPRSSWKGFLKLSLVTCPVALYSATSSSEKVSFNQLNEKTGNRLKQQYVDADSGEVVEKEDRVKGYEVSKGEYVTVTDDEIADLKIESSHNIDIERFVPAGSVDPLYVEGHYYLTPEGKVGEEAFAVIRAAMEADKVVGIARVVLFGKERVITLEPRDKGIKISTLRYDYEVRHHSSYFDELDATRPSKEMVDLARHLISTKRGEFEPKQYKDRFQDAIVGLIRSKQTGQAPPKVEKAEPKGVVDLMAALRASLGAPAPAAPPEPATPHADAVRITKAKASAKAEVPAKDRLVGKVVTLTELTCAGADGPVVVAFDPPAIAKVLASVDGGYDVDVVEPHEAFVEMDFEPVRDAERGLGVAKAEAVALADKKVQNLHKDAGSLDGEDLKPASGLRYG